MPMKAMVYKTLSTVVDDFFAYVVLHCVDPSSHEVLKQVLHQDAVLTSPRLLPVRPISGDSSQLLFQN